MSTKDLGPVLHDGYLLARLGALSTRSWNDMLGKLGVSPLEYGALMTLLHTGGSSSADLARLMAIDARNLGPVLERLESEGMLRRYFGAYDKRRRVIELTAKGKRRATSAHKESAKITSEFLAVLSDSERKSLTKVLTKLFEAHT